MSYKKSFPALVIALLTTAVAPKAHAGTLYSSEKTVTPVIWLAQSLTAGTQYTFETKNLSQNGDTVMHLILDGLDWGTLQVAANDNVGTGGFGSKIVYKPNVGGTYYVLVRAKSSSTAGTADLYINGQRKLAQNAFGGLITQTSWGADDELRGVGTERSSDNDFLLFLLTSATQYLQHDDDSGVALYPFLRARQAATNGLVVWAAYPGSGGKARLVQQAIPTAGVDTDGDGVTNALENIVKSNISAKDSDEDGIPDNI
jgi:hypothetical protein